MNQSINAVKEEGDANDLYNNSVVIKLQLTKKLYWIAVSMRKAKLHRPLAGIKEEGDAIM